MLLLIAAIVAVIIFIVGFSRHGADFVKHGFRQNLLSELMANLATKEDIEKLEDELQNIQVNHFGHLKNYLGVLNSILLDQNIINNESKARLDNELRGM
jgi:hypothetical protein